MSPRDSNPRTSLVPAVIGGMERLIQRVQASRALDSHVGEIDSANPKTEFGARSKHAGIFCRQRNATRLSALARMGRGTLEDGHAGRSLQDYRGCWQFRGKP